MGIHTLLHIIYAGFAHFKIKCPPQLACAQFIQFIYYLQLDVAWCCC